MYCCIKIGGYLNNEWNDWFDELNIVKNDIGNTVLSGKVEDQAALYGILKKIRDLGIPLLSVNCSEISDNK